MSTRLAAAVIAICVAILLVDYAVAIWQAPRDDKTVKALQQQVKNDAVAAPKLEAEQKRITAGRRARKTRDNIVAWVLLAGAAFFFLPRPDAQNRPVRTNLERNRAATVRERSTSKPVPSGVPAIDLSFVDRIVAEQGRGKEAAIRLLQAIQTHYRYLPDEALRRLCELTEITPAQIAGTSSFYAQFRRRPVGKHILRVCHGTACHVAGATQITDQLRRHLSIPEGADTDSAREFTIEEVACLGCCSLAPVLMVDGRTAGRLTPNSACDAIAEKEPA
jgi:NADH:ubiquinone oxidoreductase subunit E